MQFHPMAGILILQSFGGRNFKKCLVMNRRLFLKNARRDIEGFSNPDNKQNHIARWLMAMHDFRKKIFLANHNPASWGGLGSTPWFLARESA
jgi:hypothetical protein